MSKKIAVFWPGDARDIPNQLALPNVQEATAQLERALKKLGRTPYQVPGFLSKPHHAIEKLSPIDDPMIGMCVHWLYGPHTCDGVVGKDNPLLLASNFSGRWPGLVGLLNTGACLESLNRPFSRAWTDASDFSSDETFMAQLGEWCTSGNIRYGTEEIRYHAVISAAASALALDVAAEIRARRILILMLGDTSMGMINGYFGLRLLNRHGFTEHKVDQAWIIDRGRRIEPKRIDEAFRFVKDKGLTFHHGEAGAEDFNEGSSKEQLRDYLVTLDLLNEFKADCLGWQYQLGLIPLRPPSDLAEGLLNSTCRPESSGDTVATATEADQGNVMPMEMMKRLLKRKGLHQAVMFHDVRWGAEHAGRFLWVLLNSGSCGAYAFNHDPDSLRGAHSYRQPSLYFPTSGGTLAGESLPGKMTWARAYIKGGELWMDIGRGEVVKLPEPVRDQWWEGTTRQWPFMAADMGISRDTLMAHYLSNHVAVAYGDVFEEMVALSQELGFKVRILGEGELNVSIASGAYFLGVDVGTGSARAGLFDDAGVMLGTATQAIQLFRPAEDFVEHSSEDIWRACGAAIRGALNQAGLRADQIAGLCFDATCSLVALDADDAPVTVSSTGRTEQNVIVWMDHRALAEAEAINRSGHEVLRYVGGSVSPEMETPKLSWLKRHLPASFAKTARFLDLPDFLSYRATGVDSRSHCTTVCKWTYLGHENAGRGAWSKSFFEQIGLGELLEDGARRIGSEVRPVGERVGRLREPAAQELGLVAGIPVAVSVIDAHAGGIGLLGSRLEGEVLDADVLDTRLALIGGTSSCHMAVSKEARFVKGVWGPYYSAMIPGMWLTEGGQSATGALIDHVLQSHARYAELSAAAASSNTSVYALLNERLAVLAGSSAVPGALTVDLHVLPDHHGNRSPRADPTLRGMISGLKLSSSVETLALEYLATIQAIAHGTRHIIDTMNAHGYRIGAVIATGGDSKNPLFLREHADATGARILLPKEPEAVLLGSAILAAVAAERFPSVVEAMTQMSGISRIIEPNPAARAFHDAKQRVFLRMHDDQLAYRREMTGA